MITYNHRQFIAQAIESVLSQETDFPIELVIGEDCSNDGTRAIVEHYGRQHPGRVRLLLHPANVGAHPNSLAVLDSCRGEFIAMLEGDDYWTDPRKLQLQVEFLDSHPEMALCHTLTEHVRTSNGATTSLGMWPLAEFRREAGADDLIASNFIMTASVMFRRAWMPRHEASDPVLNVGDWHLWYLLAEKGPVGFLDTPTAAYRIHDHNNFARLSGHEQSAQIAQALFFMASKSHPVRWRRISRQAEHFSTRAASGQTGPIKAAEVLWRLCRMNPHTRTPWGRFLLLAPGVQWTILKRKLRLATRLKSALASLRG